MLVRRVSPVALVLMLALAPTASAANRFAAPTNRGTGDCLSAANACTLPTAVGGAGNGDKVFIRGDLGPYSLGATTVGTAKTIHAHGTSGRPRLNFTTGYFNLPSGSLDNVSLTGAGHNGLLRLGTSASADRVIVKSSGDYAACGASFGTNSLTNSTCWSDGPLPAGMGALEASGNPTTLRNDTIYSSGNGSHPGIRGLAVGDDGAPTVLNLVNVIARGSGGGPGVEVYSDGSVDSTANLSYTNAAAVKSTQAPSREHINGNATDQSPNAALPLFVDPAHGNFHEAPGAPTIDHGVNSAANGVHDVDGDARTVSGRTDIGADEFIPPPDTFTGVGIVTKRATVRKGRVRIAVTCPANAGGPLNGEPGSCTGELTLRTAHRVKASALTGARKKGKVLTLGTARFVLGAATTGRIRVHLSKKGRKLLKKRKTLRAVCTAVAHDGRGKVGTTSRHIKLKLAKKKKR